MRILILILVLAPQDDEKIRRINKAIDRFLDADPELREIGRRELLEFGHAAVPLLEQRLADKGVMEIYRVLREIDQKGSPGAWVYDKDLPTLEDVEKELPKLAKDAVDKYVYTKYYEAYLYARKENYERALGIVTALQALEPHSRYIDTVKQLRRFCDNKITQTTLCEARVVQAKSVYLAGDKVELTLRLRNLHKDQIVLEFDKGTQAQPGQGFAFVDLAVRIPEPRGSEQLESRNDEVRFENAIPIATGGQWEYHFIVDTGTGFDANDLRLIDVNAWTQPMRIEMGKASMSKRIWFEPALIKVVPRKYEKDLAAPLEALKKYIAGGTIGDVFTMALILEGDDKEKGLAVILAGLENKELQNRHVFAQILTFMTGQKLGPDPKKWREWFDNRGKPKKDK